LRRALDIHFDFAQTKPEVPVPGRAGFSLLDNRLAM
jgi:hypothetical protein